MWPNGFFMSDERKLARIIIERMKQRAGVRSQAKLAEVIGVTPQSLSGAIQKGKIPDRWFDVMEEKFGVTREELTAPPKQIRAALVQPYGDADDSSLEAQAMAWLRTIRQRDPARYVQILAELAKEAEG